MKPYEEFLEEKVAFDEAFGFDVRDVDLHRVLKPHQRDIVRWAVKGGRRAIFAAFGMGKSVMQLETLRLILDRDGQSGRALIVCPLGVRIEFAHDAEMLDMPTRFVRRTEEVGGPAQRGDAALGPHLVRCARGRIRSHPGRGRLATVRTLPNSRAIARIRGGESA